MKLIHLSDLHLGKRLNDFNLLEDQEFILTKIINIIDGQRPDCVIIAGDVYDKSVPSAEAVQLFDDFLCRLASRKLEVFVISGNHDSPERIAFGGRLMDMSGVHMSPVYCGHIEPVTLEDEFGAVNIYMLPFVKPANVRRFFPDADIESYTDAIRRAIDSMNINTAQRNILVTHQFVTGAERSESEDISVGGSDNVDASVFAPFDYIALGHIHRPQNVGGDNIRYCGTPLKYSFSEAGHTKSVSIVELSEKGNINISTAELVPKRDMRELRGTYMELTDKRNYDGTATGDYLHITLTDEEDIPDAVAKLRVIYPNLMKLDYDNRRTRSSGGLTVGEAVENKSPLQLFSEFFEAQNNQPMSVEQLEFSASLMEEIWG